MVRGAHIRYHTRHGVVLGRERLLCRAHLVLRVARSVDQEQEEGSRVLMHVTCGDRPGCTPQD